MVTKWNNIHSKHRCFGYWYPSLPSRTLWLEFSDGNKPLEYVTFSLGHSLLPKVSSTMIPYMWMPKKKKPTRRALFIFALLIFGNLLILNNSILNSTLILLNSQVLYLVEVCIHSLHQLVSHWQHFPVLELVSVYSLGGFYCINFSNLYCSIYEWKK